jgi:hypothetical protein
MTTEHNELKEYAKLFLSKLGFEPNEIFEEFLVKFDGMRERLIVDVAGISANRKVAIECGQTPSNKMPKLEMYFDEVILLPYLKSKISDMFVGDEKNMALTITRQEKEIEKLTHDLQEIVQQNKLLEKRALNAEGAVNLESYRIREGLGLIIFDFLDRINALPSSGIIDNYFLSNFRSYVERHLKGSFTKAFTNEQLKEIGDKASIFRYNETNEKDKENTGANIK